MPKYVKISKAKNLRFRLISVLYLLFISLSIIQIPIEWMRMNPYAAKYLRDVKSKGIVSSELQEARNEVIRIDSTFVAAVGFDKERNSVIEPSGYSAVDKFFIREGYAEELFNALVKLKKYYEAQAETDEKRKEFDRLFAADLKNGLLSENRNIWVEWKFRHVPSTVARTLLAEFKLRLNLLNGAIELGMGREKTNSLIKLAFNVDLLQLGDTASFVLTDKLNTKVEVSQGSASSNDYFWASDTFNLVPQSTGEYTITFKTEDVSEEINVLVRPTTFIKEKGEAVQFFYEGKSADLKYQDISNVGKLICDCSEPNSTTYQPGKVSFVPNRSGWCNVALQSKGGAVLINDSVYIQELPTPLIFGSNVSSNRISRARLKQQGELRVIAKHPDMDNFNYDVVNMNVTIIGRNIEEREVTGANIQLTQTDLDNVQYIQVNQVNVTTEVKDFQISEPLIIEII